MKSFPSHSFVRVERHTSRCEHHHSHFGTRDECHSGGGQWLPGFDISGHTFLLIYSALLLSEEASAYRNWPSALRSTPSHIRRADEYLFFKRASKWIQVSSR